MLGPSVDFHVQALYSLLKVPTELARKNFKSIQKLVEKQRKLLTEEVARVNMSTKDAKAKLLDVRKLIKNFKAFQKRLAKFIELDKNYRTRIKARVENLEILQHCCVESTTESHVGTGVLDLHNPALIQWYRDQTNLLITDYLLRSNRRLSQNVGSAFMDSLCRSNPNIRNLIDYDLLETFNEIYLSITQNHDLTKLVAWYGDHVTNLKRANTNMEFEISYCRYLSFIEDNDILGAIKYAQLHLSQFGNKSKYTEGNIENWEKNLQRLKPMGGLFVMSLIVGACPPTRQSASAPTPSSSSSAARPHSSLTWSSQVLENTVALHQYQQLLQTGRWSTLANYFVSTFSQYYGIPASYPLHIYLSAGLTSLKTKSCYRNTENTIFSSMTDSGHPRSDFSKSHFPSYYYQQLGKINHCPACTPEMFDLGRLLPHAQLITHIFSQPYMLPNGNIYPFQKLLERAKIDPEKIVSKGSEVSPVQEKIEDPLTHESFPIDACLRVYPA